MTNAEIRESIERWKMISRNGDELVKFFEQGNSFFYEVPDYLAGSEDVHIYPAIYKDRLVFLLIPSKFDSLEYSATISNYVRFSPAVWWHSNGTLSDKEAIKRMERWNSHYETWVPKQAGTEHGIFLAFSIGSEDFKVPECKINLALKENLEDPLGHATADLVVTNKTETRVFFEDQAVPVPPFSASASADSFYLLNMA
ncbi:MAG: hypothetical protein BM557_04870 [Flavobacterium sp. MedPE-SWcel]|uniref:hypothetical protein n=1 Tax=uncultured Flavobacterium sp. TaxID=165435 RepID=UPI000916152A|nr:hypothetical protein [uncultured Flavobacterium sp.]OIQ21092.1 MAG: hypothetical protein BM557_04870 [Flavobacterium sp. MedPE-SWcel]